MVGPNDNSACGQSTPRTICFYVLPLVFALSPRKREIPPITPTPLRPDLGRLGNSTPLLGIRLKQACRASRGSGFLRAPEVPDYQRLGPQPSSYRN